VLTKSEHLFRPRSAILWDEDKATWHGGGDEMFRAKNPPDAIVSYYLKAASSGAVEIQIADSDGKTVRDLEVARDAGIHRVAVDLKKEPVAPGSYVVKLIANGKTLAAPFDVRSDPNR